jgi:hypothetical protein
MKKFLFVIFFFCFLPLNSQMLHHDSYIDIPSADYTEGLFINLDANFPLKSSGEVKFDPNFGIEYTYRELNTAFKWYNGMDFAFDVSYRVLQEETRRPSIALGIYEICYDKFISPAGSDRTYEDEEYENRPPEIVSLYGVVTKNINSKFQINMGVGRGKFVGYGPRSFVPNTDVLFNENHEKWALGLFMGVKLRLKKPLSFILEADGRDANFALEYKSQLLKGTFYLIKMEQFFSDSNSARLGLNVSYNLSSLK